MLSRSLPQSIGPCKTSSSGPPGKSAPPNRQALPHDPGLDPILADPRLSPTAKLIVVALVKHWAWVRDHAWPSDRTIAEKVGRSPGHVQRCLRELEVAGWIRRERTDEVRSGRRIWLVWRCTDGVGAQSGPAPARTDPQRQRAPKDVIVKRGMELFESGIEIPERSRPEPEPDPQVPLDPSGAPEPEPERPPAPKSSAPPPLTDPPAPAPLTDPPVPPTPAIALTPAQQARLAELPEAARDQVLDWLVSGDRILLAEARRLLAPPMARPEAPQSVPELLARIREDPAFPGQAAGALARAFDDQKSYSGFLARCREAWAGQIPVERLQAAYQQASGPKAKKPGAVFMHVLGQGGSI